MKEAIRERTLRAAEYMARTGATVRECAEVFGIGKTTVHKDMRKRLPALNPALAGEVGRILRRNREERHLRGGQATKEMYEKRRSTRS